MSRPFLLVGLTGGIATGKSAVAEMFRALGCVVIDADVLAREVVEPGEPAYHEIVDEFGREVLQPNDRLDRKALAAIVFADPARRARLEAITHPRIRERFAAELGKLEVDQRACITIFDAALIVETGSHTIMDRLVVVVTDHDTQVIRLMARDGIGREEAERRISSQMPLEEKAKLADYVIDNSGDRRETRAQVERVHAVLTAELLARVRALGRD